MDIIDTHQHLWDLDRFELPWIEPGSVLDRSYLTADYLEAVAEFRVVKAVYMEVDVAPSLRRVEAEHVIELCRSADHPTVAAVIGGHPGVADFRDYVAPLLPNDCIKGVRQVLQGHGTPPGHCLDSAFVNDVRWLGEQGLCFDICIRCNELADAAELAKRCPDTRFVLDHCGNADVQDGDRSTWQRGIDAVARQENVVSKVSGIVVSADRETWTPEDLAPVVNHTLDAFGPHRVMFGGDWPVCTQTAPLSEWITALMKIVASRSSEEKRLLLHENALLFYDL